MKGKKDFVRNKVCIENIPAGLLNSIGAALGYNRRNTGIPVLLHLLAYSPLKGHPRDKTHFCVVSLSLKLEKESKAVSPCSGCHNLQTGYDFIIIMSKKMSLEAKFSSIYTYNMHLSMN